MGYVSDRVRMVHAGSQNKGDKKVNDIIVEPWRIANVTKYEYVAIPKDEYRQIACLAVSIACQIASEMYAYSRAKRWDGWSAISKSVTLGMSVPEAITFNSSSKWLTFDCSSLVISAYKLAGLDFPGRWKTTTSGLNIILRDSGAFDIYNISEMCNTDQYAVAGALYWKKDAHVVMAINDYMETEASIPEPTVSVPEQNVGDPYIEITAGTYVIRKGPSSAYEKIQYAKHGEIYQVVGHADNGWHQLQLKDALIGYITNAYDGKGISVKNIEEPEPLPEKENIYIEILGDMFIREKPTSISKKVGVAKKGEEHDVLEITANNWAKVERGYISLNTKNTKLVNAERNT